MTSHTCPSILSPSSSSPAGPASRHCRPWALLRAAIPWTARVVASRSPAYGEPRSSASGGSCRAADRRTWAARSRARSAPTPHRLCCPPTQRGPVVLVPSLACSRRLFSSFRSGPQISTVAHFVQYTSFGVLICSLSTQVAA